jgi:uncharacterized NAD-dependent epimerase/dehydratase family protein
MTIAAPYLLFLGDAQDPLAVKTSRGIAQWRPEKCVGELKMPGCSVSLGLPEVGFEEAVEKGAQTFILGLANRGGSIAPAWLAYLKAALEAGLDIANGLHDRVAAIDDIKRLADSLGRRIFDVRHPAAALSVGTGRKRSGKRLLTVGTDCSVGKMYATLALEKEMQAQGMKATFRATGQTGVLISGQGLSIDAVVADFISGAVESLSPDNDADHWDLIEGQGSLFHPSYAGVSLGLLHGAQPDVIILCHEVGRPHMRGLPHQAVPDLGACIEANLAAAALTNPQVRLGGICINSSALSEREAQDYCARWAQEFAVPCVDPLRHGVGPIVSFIAEL